jgi:putative hydrolase of the HAD superfamily
VVGTLRELRARGKRLGMISVCSEEVELLWPESEFGGLFDAEVFSCSARLAKPDPRIYLACCELLGVEAADAVFVGDGANDELAGARRVGMQAVLIHRPDCDPVWPELTLWEGPRIDAIPQILELV